MIKFSWIYLTITLVTVHTHFLRNSLACQLNKKQAAAILVAIDNICDDTWCEGDYGFTFKKVHCDQNTVVIDFVIVEKGVQVNVSFSDNVGYIGSVRNTSVYHSVSCKILGRYENLADILDSDRLQEDFYGKLTNCIFALEKSLRKN